MQGLQEIIDEGNILFQCSPEDFQTGIMGKGTFKFPIRQGTKFTYQELHVKVQQSPDTTLIDLFPVPTRKKSGSFDYKMNQKAGEKKCEEFNKFLHGARVNFNTHNLLTFMIYCFISNLILCQKKKLLRLEWVFSVCVRLCEEIWENFTIFAEVGSKTGSKSIEFLEEY